jgi:site-specific DNA-methyltransferase (adenine-specific)
MTKQHWLDKMDGLIIEGDILEALALLEDDSVEAIAVDPPYELKFMGKGWDASGVSFRPETWKACLRVLKPGGHMVVFGGTRTHHRMWCAVEDAGFEVRDLLIWLYGQGMPKSMDVSKAIDKAAGAEREVVGRDPNYRQRVHTESVYSGGQARPKYLTAPATNAAKEWGGWGTALKPAWEPILLARKPLTEETVAANVLKWGTGALNIDGTRISTGGEVVHTPQSDPAKRKGVVGSDLGFSKGSKEKMAEAQRASVERTNALGRWPANVLLQCTCVDPQPLPEKVKSRAKEPAKGRRYADKGATNITGTPGATRREGGGFAHEPDCPAGMVDAQTDGASRFFYCPKATKKERGEDNKHPTVKPIALMRWLVRLVTPPDGVVLDPFCGSGSTLLAATEEGFGFIGVDISPEYCGIALRRLKGRKA